MGLGQRACGGTGVVDTAQRATRSIASIQPNFVIPAKAGTQYSFHMRHDFAPCVYILASKRNGTLYTGVTSDLRGRIFQHRAGAVSGFTREYGVKLLVWFERHATMESAILREKQIKKWNRAWKLALIEANNPDWRDLAEDLGFDRLDSGFPLSRE